MNTIKQLNAIAFPHLKAYYADLFVHDKNEICAHPENTPFIHVTRKYGTRITMLSAPDNYPKQFEQVPYLFGKAGRENLLKEKSASIEYDSRNNKDALVLYFDGSRFIKVSYEKALRIVRRYQDDIKKQWGNES